MVKSSGRLSGVTRSSRTFYALERDKSHNNGEPHCNAGILDPVWKVGVGLSGGTNVAPYFHDGKVNVVYFDGHVQMQQLVSNGDDWIPENTGG